MKYRGIFEYEYPTEHKPPVSIDVYLHGDCVKGKIIEWEYRPLDQEPTTKNDLGVDWERYKDVDGNSLDDLILEVLQNNFDCGNTYGYKVADEIIGLLPSVTPQEPQTFKWCTDCREYDQEKHCCHRWSKVIRDTVEEMKQESILDKIRAEIRANSIYVMPQYGRTIREADVLHIIDKYKAETEET